MLVCVEGGGRGRERRGQTTRRGSVGVPFSSHSLCVCLFRLPSLSVHYIYIYTCVWMRRCVCWSCLSYLNSCLNFIFRRVHSAANTSTGIHAYTTTGLLPLSHCSYAREPAPPAPRGVAQPHCNAAASLRRRGPGSRSTSRQRRQKAEAMKRAAALCVHWLNHRHAFVVRWP